MQVSRVMLSPEPRAVVAWGGVDTKLTAGIEPASSAVAVFYPLNYVNSPTVCVGHARPSYQALMGVSSWFSSPIARRGGLGGYCGTLLCKFQRWQRRHFAEPLKRLLDGFSVGGFE
jgi:hypothetical protein